MTARELHESLLVVDGHCDTVLDLVGLSIADRKAGPRDFFERGKRGHIDLPRLREGGVGCQIFALFTEDQCLAEAGAHTWRLLEKMETVAAAGRRFVLARSAAQIRAAHAAGQTAGLLSIEGGEALGTDPDRGIRELRAFHARGVRLMGLTWNRSNALGRGIGAEGPKNGAGGLTPYGRRVVREMERLGMIVDASHLSDKALEELLDMTERPVVASHSNSRRLAAHRRNLDDRQAEGIAATGGLIGVTFAGLFIDTEPAKVTKERVLEHVDHLVSLVGSEHVGLGSDFDGFTDQFGLAFASAAELPLLTEALLGRGYEEGDIAAIMGGNWLRVIGEICG